jgi:hypothetical protein
VSTPAWVRRKVALSNPYEGRPSKMALEQEVHDEPQTGSLFE